MNIDNFEEYIDEIILRRGFDYYNGGTIVDESILNNNNYSFTIRSNMAYDVFVELDKNKDILFSECNCQYTNGPICKHKVASYYRIREILKGKNNKKNNSNVIEFKKNKTREESELNVALEELLNIFDKEQLVDIVLEFFSDKKSLINNIIQKYEEYFLMAGIEEGKEKEKLNILMDEMIEELFDSGVEMSFEELIELDHSLLDVIENIPRDEFKRGLELYLIYFRKMIKIANKTEDSYIFNRTMDRLMDLIISLIMEFDDLSKEQEKVIFNIIIEESKKKEYEETFTAKIFIFKLAGYFVEDKKLREKLFSILNQFANSYKDEYYKLISYEVKKLIFEIILQYGTETEIESYILKNIDEYYFMVMLIKIYEREDNFEAIIEDTKKFEEYNSDEEFVKLCRKARYKAYENISAVDEQKKLAKEIFLSGVTEYYKELKILYGKDFKKVCRELIEEFQLQKDYELNLSYRYLIKKEKDKKLILNLLSNYPEYIEEYIKLLKKDNKEKDELIKIYENGIFKYAEKVKNRSEYKSLGKMIIRYEEFAEENNSAELIDRILEKYPRKSAMKEELNKFK